MGGEGEGGAHPSPLRLLHEAHRSIFNRIYAHTHAYAYLLPGCCFFFPFFKVFWVFFFSFRCDHPGPPECLFFFFVNSIFPGRIHSTLVFLLSSKHKSNHLIFSVHLWFLSWFFHHDFPVRIELAEFAKLQRETLTRALGFISRWMNLS